MNNRAFFGLIMTMGVFGTTIILRDNKWVELMPIAILAVVSGGAMLAHQSMTERKP